MSARPDDLAQGYCIHELIEDQAGRTPEAIALLGNGRSINYGELNVRVNQLANELRRLGAAPEVFVGVCLERSLDAAVALLGILKAGGAYVYLDPDLPIRRLRSLISDCKPQLVITSAALQRPIFSELNCIDISSRPGPDADASNPRSGVTACNVAYVLYTSGSTGTPKGVLEIHRSLTARLNSAQLPDMQPGDICCLSSSLGFGITASRLFLPLAIGASVVILPDDLVTDVNRFVRALEVNHVTSVFLSPAHLRAILSLGGEAAARLAQIRAVTVTGAALTPELVKSFFQLLSQAQLVNVYGSAEIGTTAAIQILDRTAISRLVSIGTPVANTTIHLLDESLTPVAEGDSGELCVGSAHLARGYLNRPDLTAEKFVSDPFMPGGRLYRTGDLGRLLPNGEIQFLGRRDHQVKIRGFRVELGEIEMTLEEHPKVRDAAVTAQDSGNEKRLIAYTAAKVGASPSTTELRTFLSERLPGHMIPAVFVRLSRMPRTDSGKIDRQALPAYNPSKPEVDSPYEVPRSPLEVAFAEIWSDVLNIDDVGIHDNFIELGGDSLSATQAILSIRERFGIELTLESFIDRTIAEVAAEHCRTDPGNVQKFKE